MDFKILNFTIFCVNNVASFLNKSAKDVYHAMYDLISNGVADMHCLSDEYLADELLLELGYKK